MEVEERTTSTPTVATAELAESLVVAAVADEDSAAVSSQAMVETVDLAVVVVAVVCFRIPTQRQAASVEMAELVAAAAAHRVTRACLSVVAVSAVAVAAQSIL